MEQKKDSVDVIEELRTRYDELTHSQKRIAEAIVENPDFVAFATVDQFSSELGLNPSTIVRFAYRLGLDGYNDLQNRVRERIRAQLAYLGTGSDEDSQKVTVHLGDSTFASSFDHDLAILQRSISQLSGEEMARAVELLVQARRLLVMGGFASYGIAYYMAVALSRIRADTFLLGLREDELAAILLEVTSEDVLIAITFPPYASRTLHVVNQGISQGAKTIAITDSPISPAGQLVDIVLPVLSSGISTQNSQIPALALANALINAVVAETPSQSFERYRRVMQEMNKADAFVLKDDEG